MSAKSSQLGLGFIPSTTRAASLQQYKAIFTEIFMIIYYFFCSTHVLLIKRLVIMAWRVAWNLLSHDLCLSMTINLKGMKAIYGHTRRNVPTRSFNERIDRAASGYDCRWMSHNSWKQPKTLAHGPNAHVSILLQRGARGTWGIASPSMPLPVTLVNWNETPKREIIRTKDAFCLCHSRVRAIKQANVLFCETFAEMMA